MVVIAIAVAVVCAAVVSTAVRGSGTSALPAGDEAAMRGTITADHLEQEPVVPAKFYGRQSTIGPCITLLRSHVDRLLEVATSSGIWPMDTGWLYLAGIKSQIRELHGALPVSWDGRIVSWEVVEGGGDRYVVRAAVQQTLHWGDVGRGKEAAGPFGSMIYEATTDEYTLERVDGAWKITNILRNIDGGQFRRRDP